MTIRPDPTFTRRRSLRWKRRWRISPTTVLLSPDFSKPDALAVIDVKPGSPTFSQIVPHRDDAVQRRRVPHHFGWNACSSALSPLTGHAFLERRYLIIPGIRSSRI